MTTDRTTLRVAERLLESFGASLSLSAAEIRELLEGEEELMSRCLDFLLGRDELFMAADSSPRFYHRQNVIRAMLNNLGSGGRKTANDLATTLGIPMAVTCELLGWLERDGRVLANSENDISFFTKI